MSGIIAGQDDLVLVQRGIEQRRRHLLLNASFIRLKKPG